MEVKSFMFKVTEQAKKELKRIHESRSLEPGMCLRLAIPPVWTGYGNFGIVIDDEKEGDIAIFLGDFKVLIVEDLITQEIYEQKQGDSNSILDFIESPEGTRFTLS